MSKATGNATEIFVGACVWPGLSGSCLERCDGASLKAKRCLTSVSAVEEQARQKKMAGSPSCVVLFVNTLFLVLKKKGDTGARAL